MLNTLEFGKDFPSQSSMYVRVKEKGDQIRFRILQQPVYSGKHFIQKETGWDVPSCPRISTGEQCDLCDVYFKMTAEAKKIKETNPDKAKDLERQARDYNVAITFYFPILDRDNEEFKILQTTLGVRNQINTLFGSGVKIFERDLLLRNTGSASPKDRYSVVAVDSSETKPLSDKEKEEVKKGMAFDINTIKDGTTAQDELEE